MTLAVFYDTNVVLSCDRTANESTDLAVREHQHADRRTDPGLRRIHELGLGRSGRGTVWFGIAWYGMAWYAMLCYATLWCGMVWYRTLES